MGKITPERLRNPPLKSNAAAENTWLDSALAGLAMSTAPHKNKTTVAGLDQEAQQGMFLVWESQGAEQHAAEAGGSAAWSPLRSLTVPTASISRYLL